MRWLALLLFFITPALAEPATTGNVLPNLSEFTTSGSTTSSTISGCTAGEFCTGDAASGGGTYTSSFSVPLTTAELRQGFSLTTSVGVDSHPSNAVLASCTTLTQAGDCRDVFRLTVSLFDGLNLAEKFEREVELDFGGLQNFTFQDTVAANSFNVLLGEISLFGIDAGFRSTSFFGPKFSDPGLTISYQTVIEQQILDQITQATEIVTASLAPPPPPPPPAETVAASPTAGPPPPATTIATLGTQAPPAAPPPPAIEPVAPPPPPEQQQEEAAATAEVEAEVQAAEPEPQPEPGPEPATEAADTATEPETSTAPAREREQPAPRQTRQQKVRAAAQKVVSKIAPSQRYSTASQTTTMVVMNLLSGKIATGPLIKDAAAATFFSAAALPPGPSMIDPLTRYRVFGQAAGLRNTMVESQWIK